MEQMLIQKPILIKKKPLCSLQRKEKMRHMLRKAENSIRIFTRKWITVKPLKSF